ncbi:MAG: hypothetical protein V1719_02460, partial [Patescibacteria group bacterium]
FWQAHEARPESYNLERLNDTLVEPFLLAKPGVAMLYSTAKTGHSRLTRYISNKLIGNLYLFVILNPLGLKAHRAGGLIQDDEIRE